MLLCSALRGLGHNDIVVAHDGRQALKILHGRMIDLVLLDVEMPVLGGFETLQEMRADSELARIPVVMVTARADAAFVSSLRALDIAGYLIKPVTAAAIKTAIARALSGPPAEPRPPS